MRRACSRQVEHRWRRCTGMHPSDAVQAGTVAGTCHCRTQLRARKYKWLIGIEFGFDVKYARNDGIHIANSSGHGALIKNTAKAVQRHKIQFRANLNSGIRASQLHSLSPFDTFRLPGLRISMTSPSSRRHVTRGTGFPVAWHTSVASSVSCTAISADDSSLMISGGTDVLFVPT